MKLNKGDSVKYNNAEYEVVAVIWSTIYLREEKLNNGKVCHVVDNLHDFYKNIVIVESEEQNDGK